MNAGRVMGIETEYGISVPGSPHANPMILSGEVVLAYARAHGDRTRRVMWDYTGETPLSDARGFEIPRGRAHSSQLTDEAADDPTIANMVLTNGARLYVDHAHPEYSSPEVSTVLDAIAWDRAGEMVMAEAVALLGRRAVELAARPPSRSGTRSAGGAEAAVVNLYKNNTDGKGASYGTHENYLLSRHTPFARVASQLMPFFVVRQILCGAGRVGLGQHSERAGFQISSRADFFETEVGLETTFRRPIINTRDEPHANARDYRRLHVIVGDANLCDVANLLKLGTTSLVLSLIEDDALGADLTLVDPVQELRAVSHDPTLAHQVHLLDGRSMTGVQLLWTYYERCQAHLAERGAPADAAAGTEIELIMARWEQTLSDLETDPARCAGTLDWCAKQSVLQGFRERDGLSWMDPRLTAIDIQWSDVRPDKGLARRLESSGRIERLVPQTQVEHAVTRPPESTRAWFRGECVRRFRGEVASASWDSVVFHIPGHDALQRVATLEPLRGTRALTAELIDTSADATDLLRRLTGAEPGH